MKLLKGVDKVIGRLIPIATAVVEAVKELIETGNIDMIASVIKSLIPGEIDDLIIDKAVDFAKKNIVDVALRLNIVSGLADIKDQKEQLIAVFAELQKTEGLQWEQFCTQLAQQVLIDMAEDDDTPLEITWGEAGVYVELYYKTFLKAA